MAGDRKMKERARLHNDVRIRVLPKCRLKRTIHRRFQEPDIATSSPWDRGSSRPQSRQQLGVNPLDVGCVELEYYTLILWQGDPTRQNTSRLRKPTMGLDPSQPREVSAE